MLNLFIESFNLFFVIIDPLGIVPIFIGLTASYSRRIKQAIALRAVVIAGILMVFFALLGEFILKSLDISPAAFRIAGGILLLLTAVDMVVAHHLGFHGPIDPDDPEGRERGRSIAVFPLAIPLISGPGALVSVVLSMSRAHNDIHDVLSIFAALTAVLLVTYICLRYAAWVSKVIGKTGTNVLTRVFGIILAALAIQGILSGINALLYTPVFNI